MKFARLFFQKRIPNGQVSKVEARVAVMLAVMVIVFLLAWTPYAVLALTVAFVDPNIVSPALSVVPALIAKSSICYNPIIYAGMNTQVNTTVENSIRRNRFSKLVCLFFKESDSDAEFVFRLSVLESARKSILKMETGYSFTQRFSRSQVRLAGYKIMGMKRPQMKASIEDDGESRWAAGKSCTEELIMDTLKIHRSNDPISGDAGVRESQMEMAPKA